jgi:hypothetical protein
LPPTFFALLPSPTSTLPARPGVGPCPVGPTPSPSPFVVVFIGSIAVAVYPAGSIAGVTLPAGSVVSLVGSSCSWLDLPLTWPSRPDPSLPLLLCCGCGHSDRRRRARCRRPPWRGSSTTGREKKQEGPGPAGVLSVVLPHQPLTLQLITDGISHVVFAWRTSLFCGV